MKLIIAGGRDLQISTFRIACLVLALVGKDLTAIEEVVSGRCRGIDRCGEKFAKENGIPVKPFPANWNGLGRAAGPLRNRQMAEYADALLLIWNGKSDGSASMLEEAREHGLQIWEWRVPHG